jgi:lipoprotein-anchoring transpeptidase ErfK/SrfK
MFFLRFIIPLLLVMGFVSHVMAQPYNMPPAYPRGMVEGWQRGAVPYDPFFEPRPRRVRPEYRGPVYDPEPLEVKPTQRRVRVKPPIPRTAPASFTPQRKEPIAVNVSLSRQIMNVSVGGRESYIWRVSTGREGFDTPLGTYSPDRLEVMWRSRRYHFAPMPHSIFFHGGYAIHGTSETRRLGRRASHGCIRLSPGNAAKLFAMVKQVGMSRVRITISE